MHVDNYKYFVYAVLLLKRNKFGFKHNKELANCITNFNVKSMKKISLTKLRKNTLEVDLVLQPLIKCPYRSRTSPP